MPPEAPKVRTFEQDVAESMRTKQATVLHVALAEQEKKEVFREETERRRSSLWMYLVSFIFIVGGVSIGWYVYTTNLQKNTPQPIPTLVTATDVFTVDNSISVEVNLSQRTASVALLSATGSIDDTPGTITKIVPFVTETNPDSTRKARSITSQEFFALLGDNVPDLFRRSLQQDIQWVRVAGEEDVRGAIVVQTNDYDRTAVGLTAWERSMITDIQPLFGYTTRIENVEIIEIVEEVEIVEQREEIDPRTRRPVIVTSTTTEPVSRFEESVSFEVDTITFTNDVRRNIELRIAKGSQGKEYIVYGFPRRNTLVIAGSTESFLAIVARLARTPDEI